MKIKFKRIFLAFFVLIFFTAGCAVRNNSGDYKNKYIMDVYYKPEELSIFVSQRIIYKNTEDVELENLYFHIYPNAFRKEDTAPMIGGISDNYPRGFNPGQIDLISVKIDNKSVNWTVGGNDKTILSVKPQNSIKPNEKIEITIDYQEKIPEARTDFGSYKGVACFENWYPIICVYDSQGWHIEPSCKMGEANFSEIADYIVNINLPQDEVVASSGECVEEKNLGSDRKIITLKAEDVRDFTWVSSSRFKSAEKKAGNVTIRSYFLQEDEARGIEALNFGVKAIEFFSETFGEYPYDTFNIVETYLYGGAMEYPLLTAIGEQYYKYPDIKALESAVSHEIAHQWWYVVVGNNEYKEPWLDEALASYSEAMYFEKYHGEELFKEKINSEAGLMRFERAVGDSMDKFKNGSEYNIVVYMKGSFMIDQLRKKVGDEKFIEVMKTYYDKYKFKNASAEGFIEIIGQICGRNAANAFRDSIYNGGESYTPSVDYPETVVNF